MVIEWNGARVHISEYEKKHPQLEPRPVVADPQGLRNARPARTENPIERVLKPNAFLSGSSGSAVITVTEASHGRSTSDTVRFKKAKGFDGFTSDVLNKNDGYSITVATTDTYTFSASSGTATTGGVSGGGNDATAGPVTVTP